VRYFGVERAGLCLFSENKKKPTLMGGFVMCFGQKKKPWLLATLTA
jgi:hypothetical protein